MSTQFAFTQPRRVLKSVLTNPLSQQNFADIDSLHCFSPAKLNLFLHINSQREDGYHELQTVFQFLDYSDELHFQIRTDDHIFLDDKVTSLPTSENIIIKAAQLLKKTTQCSLGVDIHLYKRIPMGGGLGGGSSNAAATLVALNHLWQLHLSIDKLMQLGLKLGADVPIFLYGRAAWAEGVGEKLNTMILPEPWAVVVIPPCNVSTEEIFSHPQLTRDTPPITIEGYLHAKTRNDAEQLVRKLYPPIDFALNWLSQYADARLTGTGSCVFALVSDKAHAQEILAKIPNGYRGFKAKLLNRSPLFK